MKPNVIFGTCRRCGGKGDDYPVADLTSADAQDNIESGNGLYLEYYNGRYVCRRCKKELIAEEESIVAADRFAKTKRFLSDAGFLKLDPY